MSGCIFKVTHMSVFVFEIKNIIQCQTYCTQVNSEPIHHSKYKYLSMSQYQFNSEHRLNMCSRFNKRGGLFLIIKTRTRQKVFVPDTNQDPVCFLIVTLYINLLNIFLLLVYFYLFMFVLYFVSSHLSQSIPSPCGVERSQNQ